MPRKIKTAFTGSDSTPYAVAAIGLLGLGLAGLYIARRRSARSFSSAHSSASRSTGKPIAPS